MSTSTSRRHLSLALPWLGSLSSCAFPASPIAWIELIQRVPMHMAVVDGHRMAYLDVGQGPTVMLIHGFGGSMWNWEHQLHDLSAHHRVVIMDLLGSGLSDKPAISYTPSRMVHCFAAFMEVLHIKQATLIGNSMGAGLAIAMALDHPDRVTNLVLISGFPPDPYASVGSKPYRYFFEHRPPLWLSNLFLRLAGRRLTRRILEEIIHDRTLITPIVVERSSRIRQAPGFLSTLYSLLDNMNHWTNTYGQRFHELAVPTLILWGTKDRVLPHQVGEDLHQRIPRSRFHAVPEAGHMPQWENPILVNRFILDFLAHTGA